MPQDCSSSSLFKTLDLTDSSPQPECVFAHAAFVKDYPRETLIVDDYY